MLPVALLLKKQLCIQSDKKCRAIGEGNADVVCRLKIAIRRIMLRPAPRRCATHRVRVSGLDDFEKQAFQISGSSNCASQRASGHVNGHRKMQDIRYFFAKRAST